MATNMPQEELYDRIEERPLSALLPQPNNLNKHTQRGMGMLEKSIGEIGWIGAGTMAADGTIFDGSARHEKADALESNALIIKTDGTQPVYVMRTDIPTAADERAVKAGLLANRVAEVNLDWDVPLLVNANNTGLIDIDDFWLPHEQEVLLEVGGEDGQGSGEPPEKPEYSNAGYKGKFPITIIADKDLHTRWAAAMEGCDRNSPEAVLDMVLEMAGY